MTGPTRSRRPKILSAIALAVVMIFIASACETTQADHDRAIQLINQSRSNSGRAALTANIDLSAEADRWAQEMRNTCTLKHRKNLANGVPPGWTMVGENVGYGGSLNSTHNNLMNSTGHRNNILSNSYTHVGVGVVKGDCWGWSNTWVVQIFMRYTG